MLRKHTLGFTGVLAAAVVVAIAASGCSSTGAGKVVSVGPTFASQSLYATNSTQNGISIYPAGAATGSAPQYQIGGSNTTLAGPQYVTLDSTDDIFTTNWSAGSGAANIIEFKALATGNVLPYASLPFSGGQHFRGIFDYVTTFSGATTTTDVFVTSVVDPTQPAAFQSQLQFYAAGSFALGTYKVVAGPLTGLNVPIGVAADANGNVYVANSQGGNVEEFTFPSPSPTPSPTATPTQSPTPSPTPSGATASPTPTVAPTPTPVNTAPVTTLTTDIGTPTGIALDSSGNIYIADQASTSCHCPAILRFPAGATAASTPAILAGAATLLYAPTDVKVDSNGKIYVADSTSAGAGVIYVFAPLASGNVAPIATLTSPGAVTGLGLSP